MSYKAGFIFTLIALSFTAAASEAMAKCIANKWVVTGKLEQVVTRDAGGKQVTRFHLVPKKKICIDLAANKRRKIYNVRRLEVHLRDARTREDVKRFLGLNVTLKGTYRPTRTRAHGLDAVVDNAVVMGAFDPRNGKFHNWSALQHRMVRKRREQTDERAHLRSRSHLEQSDRHNDTDRRRYRTDNEAGQLTRLIRESVREIPEGYERNRTQKNQRRTHRDPAYRDIIAFLSDEFLQFHQMHPADVAEFYAPVIEFNGNGTISREYAIRKKFRQYRRSRENRHELLRRTLNITKSSQYERLYHVSFEYEIKHKEPGRRVRWSRKKVNLMLDLEQGAIQIMRESIRPVRRVRS